MPPNCTSGAARSVTPQARHRRDAGYLKLELTGRAPGERDLGRRQARPISNTLLELIAKTKNASDANRRPLTMAIS